MLAKPTYLKVIFTTLALISCIAAAANETKFKIAVVKNTIGSHSPHVLAFNENMNSCAAFTQAKKAKKSELTCTAAISSVKSIKGNNKKVKYLESLSYSNRGISRYMNDDFSGAMNDFIAAILVDSNAITRGNLKLIKQRSLITLLPHEKFTHIHSKAISLILPQDETSLIVGSVTKNKKNINHYN